MLRPNEYMNHAPAEAGVKVRMNHASPHCSGNSKSMVVERKNDGTVSAKCFRCGQWGSDSKTYKPSMFSAPENKIRSKDMPSDLTYKWSEWSVKATTYINKFGFTETDTTDAGIGWSKSLKRLVIPVKNRSTSFAGWIAKSWEDNPRYYTATHIPEMMYYQVDKGGESVLIVEDTLSAIRGGQLRSSLQLSSFALLGTTMTNKMFRELSRYSVFYIWLDNDNSIVKQKQLELFNRLSLFGEVKMIKSDIEVKELDIKQIEHILYI